jgi:hypothetical protein
MANEETQNWRTLCKAVSAEQDSRRLQYLLAQLLKSLDEPAIPAISGASIPQPILRA